MLDETRKRVLAIDYGSKRVGIAISDPLCLFPSITVTISNDKNFFSEILNLIQEKNVNKIILGYPFDDKEYGGLHIHSSGSHSQDKRRIKPLRRIQSAGLNI